MQKHVFTLVGRAAKFKGKPKKWWKEQVLWWQGNSFERGSQEYQDLLDEAFRALFSQNKKARNALLATREAVLTHRIGKNDSKRTVLTESEFVKRLTKIRGELLMRERRGK